MSHTNWVFTWNNYEEDDIQFLKDLVPGTLKYLAFAREIAPTTGTPHLQGYLCTEKKIRPAALKKILGDQPSFQFMRGNLRQSDVYCSKEGILEHYGVRPADPGTSEKKRWNTVMTLAKKRLYSEIMDEYPDIWIRHSRALKQVYLDVLQVPKEIDMLDNYWYTGRAGTGKSRTARSKYPDAYIKMANKWWDGYTGQEVVIIEDWSPDHVGLVNDLKLWTDHGRQTVESKGGSFMIRPKTIIITSQYEIEECFSRVRDSDAIVRRFKVVKF